MATQELLIAPHRFAVGYHRQTFWNWLIGTAFFLGGVEDYSRLAADRTRCGNDHWLPDRGMARTPASSFLAGRNAS